MSAVPAFDYDEDNRTLSLHWRNGAEGLMVIIAHDGMMSWSRHGDGKTFTTNIQRVPLPTELVAWIKRHMAT